MGILTNDALAMLHRMLDRRLQTLRDEVRVAEAARRAARESQGQQVTDRKDEAAQQQLFEVDSAQALRDLAELAQVEAALRRMDLGGYGDCEACGQAIPLDRLLAQPAASHCIACQGEVEHAMARGHTAGGHVAA